MIVRSYLESVPREEIEDLYRAFHAPPYTGDADELVAEHLTVRARARGYDLEIKGATLGRYRSTIGLVRSPRATVPPEWASVLSSIESALWAIHGLLKRCTLVPAVDRPVDAIEEGRPL